MTYRVLMRVPDGLTFDMLTEEQQAAINSVFGQFVLPMVGTITASGKVICDGVAADNFDPTTLGPLGLPFEIIGLWREDSSVVIPLDETVFIDHLPEPALGEKVLYEPHRWAGWPKLFGD